MNIDYGQMKSQTMGVLSNPTIISYSLIFCSTLILGYYTLHDSQAFKPSEESGEKPAEKTEENKSSFGLPSFGNADAEKPAEKPAENKSSFVGPAQEPKPEKENPQENAKPEIGGKKKSRKYNKKLAKNNKSKKNHKL